MSDDYGINNDYDTNDDYDIDNDRDANDDYDVGDVRKEKFRRALQKIQNLYEGSGEHEDDLGYQEPPGFFWAVKSGFVKFVNTNTRASRSEIWYWTLFLILLTAAYTIPAAHMITAPPMRILKGEIPMENGKALMKTGLMTLMIGGCVMKILWLPTTAMWIRRFHDLNWPASIALALCVLDFVLGTRFASRFFYENLGIIPGSDLFTVAVRHVGTLILLAVNFKPGVEDRNEYGPPFRRSEALESSDEEHDEDQPEEYDESL